MNDSCFPPSGPILLTEQKPKNKAKNKNVRKQVKQARGSQPILSLPKNARVEEDPHCPHPFPFRFLSSRKIKREQQRKPQRSPFSGPQQKPLISRQSKAKEKRPTSTDSDQSSLLWCVFLCTTLSSRSRCGYCMGLFLFLCKEFLCEAHSQFLSATGSDGLRS